MSTPPLRRTDHLLADDAAREILARGFCEHVATIGADGYPYCVPLLYVVMDGAIYLHNTSARGHLRLNVEHEPRVCFEIDEPGPLPGVAEQWPAKDRTKSPYAKSQT
jgi:uncharacterized protein